MWNDETLHDAPIPARWRDVAVPERVTWTQTMTLQGGFLTFEGHQRQFRHVGSVWRSGLSAVVAAHQPHEFE